MYLHSSYKVFISTHEHASEVLKGDMSFKLSHPSTCNGLDIEHSLRRAGLYCIPSVSNPDP